MAAQTADPELAKVYLETAGEYEHLAERAEHTQGQGCSTLLDGLTESALQHRVREVKRLLRNGIRESGNL